MMKSLKILLAVAALAALAACGSAAANEPATVQAQPNPAIVSPPPAAPTATVNLIDCTSDGAAGTVKNTSAVEVDIYLETEYLNGNGAQLRSGMAVVYSLSPGQTGHWDDPFFGDVLDSCKVAITDVFPS